MVLKTKNNVRIEEYSVRKKVICMKKETGEEC